MERKDLLTINATSFREQGEAINKTAADDIRVVVVGNPCNTNCLIAMHHAPDVPSDRFSALTRLDQNRAVAQLAIKSGKLVTDVTKMTIWGNHSATQYPDFENALIDGQARREGDRRPRLAGEPVCGDDPEARRGDPGGARQVERGIGGERDTRPRAQHGQPHARGRLVQRGHSSRTATITASPTG